MKRYKVQVNIGVTAESEEDAKDILKQIIRSGKAEIDGTTLGIVLHEDPIVEEMEF